MREDSRRRFPPRSVGSLHHAFRRAVRHRIAAVGTRGPVLLASCSAAPRVLGIPRRSPLSRGMLAGSDGIGRIRFEDLDSPSGSGPSRWRDSLRWRVEHALGSGASPGVLPSFSTLGVATAAPGGRPMRLGMSWEHALLLGAIVSSTDARRRSFRSPSGHAAIKRGSPPLSRWNPSQRSARRGSDDGSHGEHSRRTGLGERAGERAGPLLVGLWLERASALRAGGFAPPSPPAGGLYPVVALALAFVAFGVPTLIHGSGFLAVYVTGIVLGNGPIPYRPGVQRVSEAKRMAQPDPDVPHLRLARLPIKASAVAGVGVAIALLRDRGAAVGRDALPGSVSIPAPRADLRRLGGFAAPYRSSFPSIPSCAACRVRHRLSTSCSSWSF